MQIYRQAPIRNRGWRKTSDVSISLDDIEYVESEEHDPDYIEINAIDSTWPFAERNARYHVHLSVEEILYAFAMIPPERIKEASHAVFDQIEKDHTQEFADDSHTPRSTEDTVAGAMAMIQAALARTGSRHVK